MTSAATNLDPSLPAPSAAEGAGLVRRGHLYRRLLRGSFGYAAADLLTKSLAFLLVPVYTRHLTAAEYGIVGAMTALSSMLGVALGLGLRGAVVRHYYDHRDDASRLRAYLGSVSLLTLGVGLATCTLVTLAWRLLPVAEVGGIPVYPYVVIAVWSGFFAALSSLILSLYRAREQVGRYAALQVVSAAATLSATLWFVVAQGGGATGYALAVLASGALVASLSITLLLRESTLAWRWPLAASALRYGAPLVPHLFAAAALASADRVLLERWVDLHEIGVYTLGYQLGMGVGIVAAIVNAAWTPIFYDTAENYPDAPAVFSRSFTLYTGALAIVAGGAVLFAGAALALVAPAGYEGAEGVVGIVAVGYLFQGLYFMASTAIFYTRGTRWLPLITGASAALNVTLLVLLSPRFGIVGAAWATLAGFAALFLLALALSQRRYWIGYDWKRVLTIGGLFVGLAVAAQALPDGISPLALASRAAVLGAFAFALFALRLLPVRAVRELLALAGAARRRVTG